MNIEQGILNDEVIFLIDSPTGRCFARNDPVRSELPSWVHVPSVWTSNGASNCAEKRESWPI